MQNERWRGLNRENDLTKTFLSIVIPVYNEAPRLDHLTDVVRYLGELPFRSELVVVNDGSTDDTLDRLQQKAVTDGFKILTYARNRGKGYAVCAGMLRSQGQYRLFMDVDLSTPLDTIARVLPHLEHSDVVIGSRRQPDSVVEVRQPWLRETLGRGFTALSRVLLRVPVRDFTCGFKVFSAPAALSIFPRCYIDRWGFDTEVLFLAHHQGFRVTEVPVSWRNDARTKVRFPQDIVRSLADLIEIRTRATRMSLEHRGRARVQAAPQRRFTCVRWALPAEQSPRVSTVE